MAVAASRSVVSPRRDARRDRVMTSIAPGVSMARGGSSVVGGQDGAFGALAPVGVAVMFAGEQAGDAFGEEPGRGDVDGDAPAVGDARQPGIEVGGQGDVDGVGLSQQFQCALGEGRVGESGGGGWVEWEVRGGGEVLGAGVGRGVCVEGVDAPGERDAGDLVLAPVGVDGEGGERDGGEAAGGLDLQRARVGGGFGVVVWRGG